MTAEETDEISIKVITVDDSPLIAERLDTLITGIDGVMLQGNAETISDALALVESIRPDVIILDVHLAKDKPRTGIDLLRLFRRMYPNTRVIMLTNMSQDSYRTLCESSGAYEFLDKSTEFDKIPELLSRIRFELKGMTM